MSVAICGLLSLSACHDGGASRGGYVTVSQYVVTGTTLSSQNAAFLALPLDLVESGAITGCTTESAGACTSVTCPGTSTITGHSAGDITIAVDAVRYTTLVRNTSGFYGGAGSVPTFTVGQTVTATATGGEVPAFELSARAPAAPTATLPATFSRSAPNVVRWDASVDADFVVVAVVGAAASTSGIITCRDLDPTTGSVEIPETLLAELDGAAVTVGVGGYREVRTSAGSYDVALEVVNGTMGSAALQ